MTYTVRPLNEAECARWDEFVAASENELVFSTLAYLRHLERVEVLGVLEGQRLVCGFPAPIEEQHGGEHIRRSSYLSPYFGPVFAPVRGMRVRAERTRRSILSALIDYMQARFDSIVLPLNSQVADMTPFQRAHFQLELRYTYELDLSSLDTLWRDMDACARNHIRRCAEVQVIPDGELREFDFAAALSYEDAHACERWRQLVEALTSEGAGEALVAWHAGRPVAGAFVAYDRCRGYNLLSYFNADARVRGVPSKLIWCGAQRAAARGLRWFDLEGSVLPSIEAFFQSFGGLRRSLFQVHWYKDRTLNKPVLYEYDAGLHG